MLLFKKLYKVCDRVNLVIFFLWNLSSLLVLFHRCGFADSHLKPNTHDHTADKGHKNRGTQSSDSGSYVEGGKALKIKMGDNTNFPYFISRSHLSLEHFWAWIQARTLTGFP